MLRGVKNSQTGKRNGVNKRKYQTFKKHFWIPFGFALLIILIGIIMTVASQTDEGAYSGRGSGTHHFELTGPGVIGLGVIVAVVLLYSRKYIK